MKSPGPALVRCGLVRDPKVAPILHPPGSSGLAPESRANRKSIVDNSQALKTLPTHTLLMLASPRRDHCKLAVLNSLGSPASRRVYEYAIDQFIAWYCSEPRLSFNRIVVVRYRMYLESHSLAANTINQQLAAVRRLAYEAADSGLLSPELAAGISRVKGVKQLGFRSGNWLSAEESSEVLKHACGHSMRCKRGLGMVGLVFCCGFWRSEFVRLELDEIQM